MASANLLNSTKNTENFGFYRHYNFFYEFRKNHTCPKDDWNIFLGRPYQTLLVSDDRTVAKVRPCLCIITTTAQTQWVDKANNRRSARLLNDKARTFLHLFAVLLPTLYAVNFQVKKLNTQEEATNRRKFQHGRWWVHSCPLVGCWNSDVCNHRTKCSHMKYDVILFMKKLKCLINIAKIQQLCSNVLTSMVLNNWAK